MNGSTPPPNTIPPRFFRFIDDQPQAHTSPRQILGLLRGINLQQFADPDGTLTGFTSDLLTDIIPEASAMAVKYLRNPFDLCRMIQFEDGNGTDEITLPYKNINFVNVLFVRILPSLPWYRFTHFRNVDGTEFNRAGYTEPAQNPAYVIGDINLYPVITPPYYTGVEDADILVDTRARTVIIPPRALLLAAGLPLSNYSFIVGKANVEIHFTFGYAPTKYLSGAPLTYDPTTGVVQDPNPSPPAGALWTPDSIDWSSGMPVGLTRNIARLAVNNILRQNWRGITYGLSSLSVDGATESYGSKPYGGDLDDNDTAVLKALQDQYGIAMVL